MIPLPRPVTKMNCSSPASLASSTAYWTTGLSTTGSISLGTALVAGRKRVPMPATGKTAFRTGFGLAMMHRVYGRDFLAYIGGERPHFGQKRVQRKTNASTGHWRSRFYRLSRDTGIAGRRPLGHRDGRRQCVLRPGSEAAATCGDRRALVLSLRQGRRRRGGSLACCGGKRPL